MSEAPSTHQPLERSSYRTREIRTGLSARGRYRRGWFHIVLGAAILAFFPALTLLGPTRSRFMWIAGAIVMVLVGMQQISRGIDELSPDLPSGWRGAS